MSAAESILYEGRGEVHPGAGLVSMNLLAKLGNSRYLYERYDCYVIIELEWNRD